MKHRSGWQDRGKLVTLTKADSPSPLFRLPASHLPSFSVPPPTACIPLFSKRTNMFLQPMHKVRPLKPVYKYLIGYVAAY